MTDGVGGERGSAIERLVLLRPDDERLERYHRLLTEPGDRGHFPGVPTEARAFRTQLGQPSVHVLAAVDAGAAPMAFGIIRDADAGQHDHWIERLVVEPELRSSGPGRTLHAGRSFLRGAARWAFTEPTHDGRQRTKLDTAVVMFVPDWERPYFLFRRFGFEVRMVNPNQADVEIDGDLRSHDVVRMELLRANWRP